MAARFQVVEKTANGVDWELVRYSAYPMDNFDSKEEATEAVSKYLTEVNVNNALTADSKLEAIEAFMVTDDGIFLGKLDGEDWYFPNHKTGEPLKDIVEEKNGRTVTTKAENHYLLAGKTVVAVRQVPGS